MRIFLALLIFLSSPAAQAAGGFSHSVTMDPETRDSITVSSMMDNMPTVGFVPLKVVIDNRSATDRSWSLSHERLDASWIRSSWTFPVKAGSRGEFAILVPLKTGNFGYRWGMQYNWSGPGVNYPLMQLPQTGTRSSSGSLPFIGISDSLHTKHWSQLQGEDSNLMGTSLALVDAPADWRAYSGLDQIWMSSSEWTGLPNDVKNGLLEAITFGSDLVLVCPNEADAAAVKASFNHDGAETRNHWYRGAGRIELMIAANHNLSISKTMNVIRPAPRKAGAFEGSNASTLLTDAVAPIGTAGPLVLLFIVLFGVIAGPVNLFVLAPVGRRHRLFVTTPLISLAGALILALSIFIQDGTGGSGTRVIHAQILPDQKRLLITQEQMARTGLLLGSSFATAESTWVQPLGETSTPGYSRANLTHSLAPDGTHSGDWFRSRTRQRHVIQSVRPSRAAIEFTPGESPSILSTMEASLKTLYVKAPDGTFWKAQNVSPGSRTPLTKADDMRSWWQDLTSTQKLTGMVKATTDRAEENTAHFYAEAEPAAPFVIDTLSSIRWQTPILLISGSLTLKP